MKERLVQLLDLEQLSPSKFADIIGVQRSSVSHIISGRNKPSFDFLQKTLKAFPGLHADWLILGEGTMYEHMGRGVSGNLFDPPLEPAEASSPADISEEAQLTDQIGDSEPADQDPGFREKSDMAQLSTEAEDTYKAALQESGRKIVQVMVFYDDDTFRSFDPSQ
ncbi:MAG: helix-turn-helix transcriptional regulator [Bacteroidota bacterium]